MKKLILLAMVLGLFTVGTARADGAWVLWEEATHSNNPQKVWRIVGAYSTSDTCREEETFLCKSMEETWKHNCKMTTGGHYFFLNTTNGTIIYRWMCLPESVDPRK